MLLTMLFCSLGARATTFYIRADGGTRYSANVRSGQCDGKADLPASGAKAHHCAFNDWRFMYDNVGTSADWGWETNGFRGGDTVILDNTAPWTAGFKGNTFGHDVFSCGGKDNVNCINATIPAGTSSAPTRIWGRCALTSCSAPAGPPFGRPVTDHSKLSELDGNGGVYAVLNLGVTSWIDVEGLNVTRRSTCGSAGYTSTRPCRTGSTPLDATDGDGIDTYQSGNLTFKDVWSHGNNGYGIKGSFTGNLTALRVNVSYNVQGGWNFDDNSNIVGGTFTFQDGIVWGNGCYQEYPIVDQNAMLQCHGQLGNPPSVAADGMGSAHSQYDKAGHATVRQEFDVAIDHSVFAYNIQDAEDFGPMQDGRHSFRFTDNMSFGNGGAAVKFGAKSAYPALIEGNLLAANCARLANGAPPYESTHAYNLEFGVGVGNGDVCRAGDLLPISTGADGSITIVNNTVIGYMGNVFDFQCYLGDESNQARNCDSVPVLVANNIFRLYSYNYQNLANPADTAQDPYGGSRAPAVFCGPSCNEHQDAAFNGYDSAGKRGRMGTWTRYNNVYYGARSCPANQAMYSGDVFASKATHESCADPLIGPEIPHGVNLPKASTLDVFDDPRAYRLNTMSPAYHGGGAAPPGYTVDLLGHSINSPPDIGGLAYFPQTATRTTVAVPAAVPYNTPFTLSASVSPPAAGTILFSTGGGATLGSATAENGTASLTTSFPYGSSHYLRATFLPSSPALAPSFGEGTFITTAPVRSLALSASTAAIVPAGKAQLTTIAHQADGTDQDVSASTTYTSSPGGLVVIDGHTLTGRAVGATTVTATFGGQSTTLEVRISPAFKTTSFASVRFGGGGPLRDFSTEEGAFTTSAGSVFNNSNGNNLARYTGRTFESNHAACLTMSAGSSNILSPAVRVQSLGGYFLYLSNGSGQLWTLSGHGGGGTGIGSIFPWGPGDTICLAANGTTLSTYVNGAKIEDVSNSLYPSGGSPGIFGFQFGDTAASRFQAGNLSGGEAGVTPTILLQTALTAAVTASLIRLRSPAGR